MPNVIILGNFQLRFSTMNQHSEYKISGVSVYFPCKPYPSQFSMMDKIIKGIERRQNCLLESPTGSGKSLALLCSSLAWQLAEKEKRDREEEEMTKTALCICDCHNLVVADVPTTKTDDKPEVNPQQESIWQQSTDGQDSDEDFQDKNKIFNLPGKKKSPRTHVKISYEDEKTKAKPVDLDMIMKSVGDILNGVKQEPGPEENVKVCQKCCCDKSTTPGRTTRIMIPKIYFGTRTHKQVAQIVRELKRTKYHNVKMTVLGSREHTCIHPEVSRGKNKNDACKELLNGPGCRFKEWTPRWSSQSSIKSAGLDTAWDLEELVHFCRGKRVCPYFLSRAIKDEAELIICPYNYLIDPLIREAMSISLKGHIVILDEAHNIEDSAREAASQSISQEIIQKAVADIDSLIERDVNLADYSKLRSALKKLDIFIDENKDRLEQKDFEKAYRIWSSFDIVVWLETVGFGPKHFPILKSALAAVKSEAEERKEELLRAGLNTELHEMKPATAGLLEQIFQVLEYLYRAELKYVDDYRASLVQSYQYTRVAKEGQWLNTKGGYGGRNSMQTTTQYTLNFWCMNPGVAFSDFAETRSIILTSGTLSPLNSFESELSINFGIQLEANHVIKDSQVWVGTLGTGPSGGKLQAVYRNIETFAYQDELGALVLRVCEIVPHGVLCFLPSYNVLNKLTSRWESTGVMKKIASVKRIIIEPRGSDKTDFEGQMEIFYEALKPTAGDSILTGAVFFAVCRGKVSEGLDFADNFARAVITVGIPFPNFKDVQVEQKKQYNDSHRRTRALLSGQQWYETQGFRALNQALGRCIRHRQDWGALIIVDERFVKDPPKYCSGLSKWVRSKVQTFPAFNNAMNSLTKFIEERQHQTDVINPDLSQPVNSSIVIDESPRFSLCDVSNVPAATFPDKPKETVIPRAVLPQRNFSIFNLSSASPLIKLGNQTKTVNNKHVNNLAEKNKSPNTPDKCADVPSPSIFIKSKRIGGNRISPSAKLSSLMQGKQISSSGRASKIFTTGQLSNGTVSNPIVIDSIEAVGSVSDQCQETKKLETEKSVEETPPSSHSCDIFEPSSIQTALSPSSPSLSILSSKLDTNLSLINSPSLAGSVKKVSSNKKLLFKKRKDVTDDSDKPVKPATQFQTPESGKFNRSSSTTHSDGDDDFSPIEEKLLVRRKSRGKKRKSQTIAAKTPKKSKEVKNLQESPVDTTPVPTKTRSFICSVCNQLLFGGIRPQDFLEQSSLPVFLRVPPIELETGVYFFSTQPSRGGLQTHHSGKMSKYIQEEEICIQFIFCSQCLSASSDTAQPVGAQVELAANAEARFSKGQVWLFSKLVKQEMDVTKH
ncbi:Fanconi anemia group J protein homolog isoform X2 [Physella acuta]|uniref:Fanconi anemia group J protein homolog isoform X2 n=1 Tax=Physella acuta TaxID=109671 RepID=UPI0027DC4086|nr:Fanconi anemia group J protein homolog isoform X2 [Physella acuta]